MPTDASIAFSSSDGGELQESPPLLLIHGAGGDRLHWPPQLRRLRELQVYGLDLPGHGESPGEGESTIQAYVDHIVHWMDTLELRDAVWCGHSMGGAISMTAALTYPQRVVGLVLVGTGARLRVNPDILEISSDPSRFSEASELVTAWAFAPTAPKKLIELGKERYGSGHPEVLHHDFMACDEFDIMDRLGEIHCPTLILCGEDDQLTPLKYSCYLHEHIRNSNLETFSEAGHMVMLEKPEAVTEEITEFMLTLRN